MNDTDLLYMYAPLKNIKMNCLTEHNFRWGTDIAQITEILHVYPYPRVLEEIAGLPFVLAAELH